MSKDTKLEKKEAKAAKKAAAAEHAAQKTAAKADKKHAKDYDKFVKESNKKNQKNSDKPGYTPIVIPPIDEFQSKSEIKIEKANDKAYASYVKKIEKKNAKMEAKCLKKGTPFVPIAIPDKDAVVLQQNKTRKIITMIILILLIWALVYFIIMWINYIAPNLPANTEQTTVAGASNVYEPYSNPHEITTTPDYTVAEAKLFLKQVIHDNYKTIGYSSDVSNSTITYNNKTAVVNNADCYIFTCSGKTYAVPIKLSGCYVYENGGYQPLTFNNTDIIFGE
ncbi:MAG: hypothetical protein LUG21_06245 [Clostridiales bacterium]|nr:hypothetical protein [Clostridiales bacterium]